MKKLKYLLVVVLSIALFLLVGCGKESISVSKFVKWDDVLYVGHFEDDSSLMVGHYDAYYDAYKISVDLRTIKGKEVSVKQFQEWYKKLNSIKFEKVGEEIPTADVPKTGKRIIINPKWDIKASEYGIILADGIMYLGRIDSNYVSTYTKHKALDKEYCDKVINEFYQELLEASK